MTEVSLSYSEFTQRTIFADTFVKPNLALVCFIKENHLICHVKCSETVIQPFKTNQRLFH